MATLTLLLVPACSPGPARHASRFDVARVDPLAPASAPTTSTTRVPQPRSSRSRPLAPKAQPPGQGTGDPDTAFWRALANCECASGHCGGRFHGYFQFSDDTARKVGWSDTDSYERQVLEAKFWLILIGGRGGTRSGWPVCWWVAQRAVAA